MDKEAAKRMVRETLQNSFDKGRFTLLVKNILNNFEDKPFSHRGNLIPRSFANSVAHFERVGRYEDASGSSVDILVVHLQRDTSLDRARTMQRNFISKYLNGGRGGQLKDAALVAFVSPDSDDWRFSFVKMDYKFDENGKVREEFTPARRYSFLVGRHENSHTAQSRLLPLLLNDEVNPALEGLEESFSVETVTKEFFEKYRELFLRIKESLDGIVKKDPQIRADFEAKNVRPADFAQKLLGQIVFLYFLQKKGWFGVARGKEWGEGSKSFLRELFDRKHAGYKNFFNDILEPLFYEALRLERPGDYYEHFKCRIPFLNGGLFDPIGDYDWWNTDILFPDGLFSNEKKTKEGDIGDGVLDVFDRYNFTVKEDEPLEKEVAVDPEMLGKVFENLLEVKDRKAKGTYYTPREIVHYMCQESLVNYLSTELDGKVAKGDMEILIKHGETILEHDSHVEKSGSQTQRYSFKIPLSVRESANLIDERLATIRVCDPAVGSGAFPVGMMNEIVRTRSALTSYIGGNGERTPYYFKRQAIQNCLYGVDIDQGAVEIAKLRLWLSLIVDEEERDNIKPLPNLDYKIVQGNSLLRVQEDLWNNEDFRKLEELKPLYFDETGISKKQGYREQIDDIISRITKDRKEFDFEVYFSEVFHEKGGFDVVIANPPYVSHDKIEIKHFLKMRYKVYEPFADLYCFFIEVGVNIQGNNGLLCYITSNSYLRARYGRPTRVLLHGANWLLSVINIEKLQAFDAAIVNTSILLTQRKNVERTVPVCLIVSSEYGVDNTFQGFIDANKFDCDQNEFSGDSWLLLPHSRLSLKQKIESAGKTLDSLGAKIRLGLATGANEAFVVNEETKTHLIHQDSKCAEIIRPILRGKDIGRYRYSFSGRYVLLTKNDTDVKKQYPTVYKYLESFGVKFQKRKAQGQHWSNLRACAFFDDFKKEKIVWIELASTGRFALISDEMYLLNSAYFLLPPRGLSAKFLLGILNSTLIQFYMSLIAETSGMGTYRWIKSHVKDFPVPTTTTSMQQALVGVVEKVLSFTTSKDYLVNTAKQGKVREYEKQVDQLIYQIYGLTEEEIKIVEDATGRP